MAVKQRSGIAIGLNKGHVSLFELQFELQLKVADDGRRDNADGNGDLENHSSRVQAPYLAQ